MWPQKRGSIPDEYHPPSQEARTRRAIIRYEVYERRRDILKHFKIWRRENCAGIRPHIFPDIWIHIGGIELSPMPDTVNTGHDGSEGSARYVDIPAKVEQSFAIFHGSVITWDVVSEIVSTVVFGVSSLDVSLKALT
jgi:hypothetical protein